ncbi:Protein CBG18983 [Caenorhabditis briggsae]|uniref:Protein CBG18983 n=1 Tax=Caenorhabditis briggsae TaxID=6238 RepID=A8XUH8_CAEBR|nr:Protein CBG18983 [Caenorhabditis briggsae]CAP36303.2 Protein CBG18983 [Caenorhabditis briggsae]
MVLDTSWNRTTIEFGHRGVTPVHVAALFMGTINCLLNGLIWTAFRKSPQLLTKHHLYLFYAFAVTNFFTGFFTIPTYLNLFLRNNLNCPRWSILIGSSFEIGLDKIRHIVTLSIAGERIYALFWPSEYFFLDHKMASSALGNNNKLFYFQISLKICAISVIWGVADMVWLIFEDDIYMIRIHCVTTSSSGPTFHLYFLLSTIFFGVLLSLAYFLFICKLFVLRETRVINVKKRTRENFQQVNSLTVVVILLVVIFNVLPSLLYLYDMIIGEVHFMKWGPIITIGYHCYGTLSFFFYNCRHREIRAALNKIEFIRDFINCDKTPKSNSKSIDASGKFSDLVKGVPKMVTSKLGTSKPSIVIVMDSNDNDSEIFL